MTAGTSVRPSDSHVTVSGTSVSLSPAGVLVNGSSSINLPQQTSSPQNIFTVGAQILTAYTSGIDIAGSTLMPGQPAVTISGTKISISPSGVLKIGGSTTTLAATQPGEPAVFTEGGLTFTYSSSGVVVDGTTLKPRGPQAFIHGITVSLSSSGSLEVGSQTFAVPTGGGSSSRVPTVRAFTGDRLRK